MTIEEIADEVMRDWRMGFSGIELDFAFEVAKRAMRVEREACVKACSTLYDAGPDNGCCPTYWNEALEKAEEVITKRSNLAADKEKT